jgi:L-fucose mutarotase/ribose pyranase (RbsD/FucU family)
VFAAWSEGAHGAPAALIGNMFPGSKTAEELVASDDMRIAETWTSAVSLFPELWTLADRAAALLDSAEAGHARQAW